MTSIINNDTTLDHRKSISIEKIREFKSDLDNMGIRNEICICPGLGHAFANPSDVSYASKETSDA